MFLSFALSSLFQFSFFLHIIIKDMELCCAFFSFLVPASRNEYQTIKQQLEVEKIPGVNPGDPHRSFHSLSLAEQAQMEKKRLQG